MISKIFFSVITKNSNWGILRKNVVTFKSKMVLRMKNFNIFEAPLKIWLLGGRSRKVNIEGGGGCLKRVAWKVCWFKRGLARKSVEGVDTPTHTMKSWLLLQNWLRQTCNVFVFTFAKHLFKWRDVLHVQCFVEKMINHIVLIWTIRFNVKQVKQRPLKVCITWKVVGFSEFYIVPD